MLEKATLSACKDHSDIRDLFSNSSEYIKLDDDMLLGQLEKIGGYPQKMVERIKRRDIFTKICEVKLDEEKIESLPAIISKDTDELSEKLTEELCSEFQVDQYRLICDVFKTRSPKKIHIDCLDDTEEPIDILSRSQVIPSIKPKSLLRIYSDSIIQKSIDKDKLKAKIIDLLENTAL